MRPDRAVAKQAPAWDAETAKPGADNTGLAAKEQTLVISAEAARLDPGTGVKDCRSARVFQVALRGASDDFAHRVGRFRSNDGAKA